MAPYINTSLKEPNGTTAKVHKPKYNTNCSVFGCNSRKGSDRSIHFHKFPHENSGIKVKITNTMGEVEEMDKRLAWLKVLQMMTKPVSKWMQVCSKHFTTDDYCAKDVKMEKPKLRRFVVPSQNLPNSDY